MTTFSVTTNKNWDDNSFSTRAGNDTYNIDGNSRLTIDTDTRYCLNSTGSTGNLAAVNVNAAPYSGNGEVYIDGSKVRIIPFSSSAGNVPAVGTTITEGGVSSALLGVWSAFNVEPSYPGSAMPGTGYIKVKNVTGSYSVGALTGITASATGPDTVGWIEVVGLETALLSVYYKNKFTVRGEWFEHSTLVTTGLSGSTYQLPASLANTYYAGCEVETAPGSNVYEMYPSAGTLAGVNKVASDAIRGKCCWISSQGLLRFGYDGTYTNGYLPEAGRKIRVPNINLINTTVGTLGANTTPNATLATRFEFALRSANIDIDKINSAWDMTFDTPYTLSIANSFIHENLSITKCQNAFTLTNVCVGQTAAQDSIALTLTSNREGGTITDCTWTKSTAVNSAGIQSNIGNDGLTNLRSKMYHFAIGASTTALALITQSEDNGTYTDCTIGVGVSAGITLNYCKNMTYTNTTYFDVLYGVTLSTSVSYGINIGSSNKYITIDGINYGGLNRVQTYNALIYLSGFDNRYITIRNIGTAAAPLNLGGPQVDDATWTRATTTATVTSVGHGMITGDSVYVTVSSVPAAITTILKSPITRLTDDTFTFVCVNTGATSGTLTYYQVISRNSMVLGYVNRVAEDIVVQRCYFEHARVISVPILVNDMIRTQIDNVWGDTWAPALQIGYQAVCRGMKAGPTLAAQLNARGTHWIDGYITEESPNTGSQNWSRITTTAAVTSSLHNLRTGDYIMVASSSDRAAIVDSNGYTNLVSVTAVNSNVFTFACTNAGAANGTLDFNPLPGFVAVQMNEPTTNTADQVTIDVGNPVWTGAGAIFMPDVGDQVTWESPDYIIGHTGFPNVVPKSNITPPNVYFFDVTYQIDKNDGVGYSAWKNMAYNQIGSTTVGGFTIFDMPDTSKLAVGDYMYRNNAPTYMVGPNAKIVTIDSPTQVTVDVANAQTYVDSPLTFRQYPNETDIDASKGFKLKIRVTTNTANTEIPAYWMLRTSSTSTSRAYQYPLSGGVFQIPLFSPSVINPSRTIIIQENSRVIVVSDSSRSISVS